MPRFALVSTLDNSLVNLRTLGAQPPDLPQKNWKWLPCPPVSQPAFDPKAEIVEGPTYTVNPTDVTEVWTKRNLTAQEISDAQDSQISGTLNGSVWKVLAVAFLNHENRIRALEGKTAITIAQLKAGVKALL